MTKQEYEDFKQKEKELDAKRSKVIAYEELTRQYDAITASIDRLACSKQIKAVETNDPFTYLYITDHAFCRNKLIELFEHERSLLKQKIEAL